MGDAPARFAGMVGRGSFLALAALASRRRRPGRRRRRGRAPGGEPRAVPRLPAGRPRAGRHAARRRRTPIPPPCSRASSRPATTSRPGGCSSGTAFYERGHAELAEGLFRRALERNAAHPAAHASAWPRRCSRSTATPRSCDDTRPSCRSARPRSSPCSARGLAGRGRRRRRAAAPTAAAVVLAVGGGTRPRPPSLGAFARYADHGVPPPPTALPAAPRRYAVRMLDALARLEEYELFERARAGGASGDRRSAARRALTLAELFLARGFYRLAADARDARRSRSAARSRARWRCLGKAAVAEGLFEDACRCSRRRSSSTRRSPRCGRCCAGVEQRLAA